MTQEEKIKLAEKNKYISNDTIEGDIKATELEIKTMTIEVEYLEKTPESLPLFRIAQIQASSRRTGIEERNKFIVDLQAILEIRQEGK